MVGPINNRPIIRRPNDDLIVEGDIVVRDERTRLRIDRDTGSLFIFNDAGNHNFHWDNPGNNLFFGGHGRDGDLVIFPGDVNSFGDISKATFHFNGQRAVARFGGDQIPGQIVCQDESNEQTVFVNGAEGQIIAGANGKNGTISVQDSENRRAILLEGDSGRIVSRNLQIKSSDGGNSIHLGGDASTMLLGKTLRLEGDSGRIVSRNLQIKSSDGGNSIHLGGDSSTILLGKTLRLDGKAGDIILENADCAEDFDVELLEAAEPGTVMVISDDSRLRVSDQAYDHRVAGIVAGAGKYRPGIVLGRKKGEANQTPIALMGRVYCKVDADRGSIGVGDLLTTSSILGYAMKVDDPSRAFGSVIGKALAPLAEGQSMIPVLVALQ